MPSTAPTCQGVRKDGSPCTAPVLDGGQFCYAHDPAKTDERDEARRKGGRNSSSLARVAKLLPARLGGIYDVLERAIGEVHDGSLEPIRANAIANLARAAAAVLQAGEMEQRLRDLEAREAA